MKLISKALDWAYLARERKHLEVWHRVLGLYMFLLLAWGAYRFLFRFPVWFEEIVLKGLVFGLPVFYLAFRRDKFSFKFLGIMRERLFDSVALGIGLGLIVGLVAELGNFVRYGSAIFDASSLTSAEFGGYIILSIVTAFWEQLVFSGYVLEKLRFVISDEWSLVWVVSIMFMALHLPALVFFHHLPLGQIVVSMVLFVLLSVGTSVLRLRYRNLMAPIMAHALWGIVVYLFG